MEADLCDVRLHDLRHTHASLALREGESVIAISRLLGHADPETTLKYTHPADAMVMDPAVAAIVPYRLVHEHAVVVRVEAEKVERQELA